MVISNLDDLRLNLFTAPNYQLQKIMPKIKTHKATAKRFTITKTKKIKCRKAGQGHFNARESGNATRSKRRDINVHKSNVKTIRNLIPYN